MVQLSDELVADLDRLARGRGMSRSAVIRTALTEFLADAKAEDVGRQIVDGYNRIPPSTPDAWGDLVDVADTGTAELLVRLDVEERNADVDPW